MKTIDVETIRTWLEEGRPVTVLDIRPMPERVEWSIPGSMHVDAYNALKENDPKALAEVELPDNKPVVAVCAAGKTSLAAAQQLQTHGIPIAATLGQIDEEVGIIHATREVFIKQIMMRIPPTPPNYRQIVTLNEMGLLPESNVTDLEVGANRCAIS